MGECKQSKAQSGVPKEHRRFVIEGRTKGKFYGEMGTIKSAGDVKSNSVKNRVKCRGEGECASVQIRALK